MLLKILEVFVLFIKITFQVNEQFGSDLLGLKFQLTTAEPVGKIYSSK